MNDFQRFVLFLALGAIVGLLIGISLNVNTLVRALAACLR